MTAHFDSVIIFNLHKLFRTMWLCSTITQGSCSHSWLLGAFNLYSLKIIIYGFCLTAISSNSIKVVLIITKHSPPFSSLSLAELEGQICSQCYLLNSYYLVQVNLHMITWLLFSLLLEITLKNLVKT